MATKNEYRVTVTMTVNVSEANSMNAIGAAMAAVMSGAEDTVSVKCRSMYRIAEGRYVGNGSDKETFVDYAS